MNSTVIHSYKLHVHSEKFSSQIFYLLRIQILNRNIKISTLARLIFTQESFSSKNNNVYFKIHGVSRRFDFNLSSRNSTSYYLQYEDAFLSYTL